MWDSSSTVGLNNTEARHFQIDSNASSISGCQDDQLVHRFVSIYPVDRWKSEGFVRQDDLPGWIDCHWMAFDPVKPSAHFGLAFFYVVFFFVGLSSNAVVLYVILSTKRLLTSANILIVNLAISDVLIIATVPIFVFNSIHQGPAIGKLGCTAYGFVTGLAGTSAIMTLSAIAVERYLVISRPLNVDRKPSRCSSYATCLLIWIYSALFAALPLAGMGRYVPEGYLTSCSFDYLATDWTNRIFILTFFIAAWVVPLSIIILCYTAILRAVINVRHNVLTESAGRANNSISGAQMSSTVEGGGSAGLATSQNRSLTGIHQANVELAIVRTLAGLVITWLLAWTPYAVVSLLGISGYSKLITPLGAMVPALFAKSACCVDPFIYALNHPKIRHEIFVRLYRRFYRRATGSGGATTGMGMTSTAMRARGISLFHQQPLDGGQQSAHMMSNRLHQRIITSGQIAVVTAHSVDREDNSQQSNRTHHPNFQRQQTR